MKKEIKFLLVVFLLIFTLSNFSVAREAADPTVTGIGARVLGMGKAFVGQADDANAMFLNPAGLSQIQKFQLTSMTTKLLNDINYQQAAGVVKTKYGTFGLGFVGGGLDFAGAGSTIDSDGRISASTTETVSFSQQSKVLLFSYSNQLAGKLKAFSIGLTSKLFMSNLSGTGFSQRTGTGTDLDLGLLFQPNSCFRWGLSGQNILPSNMGGSLNWNNGVVENFSSTLRTGVSIKPIGIDGIWNRGIQEVNVNLDAEYKPTITNKPVLFHAGLDWSPLEFLFIRGGVDQDMSGSQVVNNLTAGVGLQIGEFRFDYAYHQFFNISDFDTHFFSMTYGVPQRVKSYGLAIRLFDPLDRFKTSDEAVKVSGAVLNKDIKQIKINGAEAVINDKGYFTANVPLIPGKNLLKIVGYNSKGKNLSQVLIKGVKFVSFKDLDETYWAKDQISYLATLNIIIGYPDKTVRTNPDITRAEFATLISRIYDLDIQTVEAASFSDVSPKYWAAPYIEAASKAKLISAYTDSLFNPEGKISRAEAVMRIVRYMGLGLYDQSVKPYLDVPADYWAAREIDAAKKAGLLKFVTGENFDPEMNVSRGEVAYMVSATTNALMKIDSLVDFNTGFENRYGGFRQG